MTQDEIKIRQLTQEVADLASENASFRYRIEDLEEEVYQAESAVDGAKADADRARAKATSAEEALLELRNELQVLEKALVPWLRERKLPNLEGTVRELALKADAAYWSI